MSRKSRRTSVSTWCSAPGSVIPKAATGRKWRWWPSLARANRNVRSVLVGNEVLLRKERTADELIALIREVKRQVSRARLHERDLVPVAAKPRAGERGRLHLRSHSAVLGRCCSRTGGILYAWTACRSCARLIRGKRSSFRNSAGQARATITEMPFPASWRRRTSFASSSLRPAGKELNTTSSKPSTSRGRSTKEASVLTGDCSITPGIRNSLLPAPLRKTVPFGRCLWP